MKKIKTLLVLSSIALISACGGGDDSSSGGGSNNDGSVTTPIPPIITTPETGDINNPITVANGKTYVLNSNYFYNNFKFSSNAGDKTFVKYSTEIPGYEQIIWDCLKFQKTHLTVAKKSGNWSSTTCNDSIKINVDEAQDFNVEVKSSGLLSVVSFNAKSILENPIGNIGTPGNPKSINFNGNNQLSSNPFYNYYKFNAKKDQTLMFKGTFHYPLDQSLKSKFMNRYNSGERLNYRYFNTVYNSDYESVRTGTDTEFDFKVPEDGVYYIEVGYYYPYTGFFNTALVDKWIWIT